MPRGRRPADPNKPHRYPNQLRQFRDQAKLTQIELAARSGLPWPEIGKIERGEQRLRHDHILKLEPALGVPPGALSGRHQAVEIPIRYRVAAFGGPFGAEDLAPARPIGHVTPPFLAVPDDCFAAQVEDDSADGDYPPKSVLFVRRVRSGEALKIDGRSRLVVAFYTTALARDDLMEILVGILDEQVSGELSLVLNTSNPELRGAKLIRRRQVSGSLGDAAAPYAVQSRRHDLAYVSRPDDLGLILGRVIGSYQTEPK